LLVQAIETLREPGDGWCLGSSDGGYYLIGLKRPHRSYSLRSHGETETVARSTCERLRNWACHDAASEWYDVDELETLRWLQDELAGLRPAFVLADLLRRAGPFLKPRADKPMKPMPGAIVSPIRSTGAIRQQRPPLHLLAGIAAILVALTLATPLPSRLVVTMPLSL